VGRGKRMLDDMKLRNMAVSTRKIYVWLRLLLA
jgi:hypothetical protein